MGGSFRFAATLAAFAVAIALTACGSNDSSDATTASKQSQESGGTTPGGSGQKATGGDERQGGSTSGSQKQDSPNPPQTSKPSEHVSPQSSKFKRYEGESKLRLAKFGAEANSSQRQAVAAAIVGYLDARDNGEWGRACSYLLPSSLVELERLVPSADRGSGGRGCASTLPAALERFSQAEEAGPSDGISSLRIKPGQGAGFALYHGTDGNDYWMPVKREGSEWKVISITTSKFGAPEG